VGGRVDPEGPPPRPVPGLAAAPPVRPGDSGQHHNTRIIAAWAYATAGNLDELQPPLTAAGRYSLRRLTELLEQPIRAGINPPCLSAWHCSVHNHPDDPILSDRQWELAATEIVAAVGLAPHGDLDAVRWLGIRHADSDIHIVVALVRTPPGMIATSQLRPPLDRQAGAEAQRQILHFDASVMIHRVRQLSF
jgi:hypothetical protein